MNSGFTRITPIAAAIALALGASVTLAQQPGQEDERAGQSAFEQRSNPGQDAQSPSAQADGAQDQTQARSDQSDRGAQSASEFNQLAEQDSDLEKFVEAIEAAGLGDALTDGTEYTVFAPTNQALEDKDIDSLLESSNRADLVAMLRAHIVADDVDEEMAGNIGAVRTLDGGTLDISADGEQIMIGGAEASEVEGVEIGNLRVYTVDAVLSDGMPGSEEDRQAANQPDQPDQPGSQADQPGLN